MDRSVFAALALVPLAASAASAQSLNISFGSASIAPSPSYSAAAGSRGRGEWNAVGLLPAGQRSGLTGLHGTPLAAQVYQIGASTTLQYDHPGTAGDDGALLDSMLISMNDPIDACVWVEGLRNGIYDVYLYALTPNDPNRRCRTRVDFSSPGPTMVGGTWSGRHEFGVSYSSFSVNVTNGTIGFHSGLYNGFIQSGLNGAQIIERTACAADWDSSGQVTLGDLFAFLEDYFALRPTADFNGTGTVSVQDIFDYLGSYFAAC